jgi:DNA polymerase III gamma and tau subunits C terminal.
LSLKLFEWTNERWIITFSKMKGELSIKDKEKNKKNELIKNAKETKLYKNMIEIFPDANLIDVTSSKKKD